MKVFLLPKFNVQGDEIRARRDQDKDGGCLIEFVRRGLICKILGDYEPKLSTDHLSQPIFQRFSNS